MLTEDAKRERMWGQFPCLGTFLESKGVPDLYFGPSSVSDNVFSQTARLLTISILVHENRSELLRTLESLEAEERWRWGNELRLLGQMLFAGVSPFQTAISDIENGLGIDIEIPNSLRKQERRIFNLALTLGFYISKFGNLTELEKMELFNASMGTNPSEKERALWEQALGIIKTFGLDQEQPRSF